MSKIKSVFFVVLVLMMFSYAGNVCAMSCHGSGHKGSQGHNSLKGEEVINSICPVMGGEVEKDTPYVIEYKNKKVGFCCPGCEDIFKSDPEKYIKSLER